MNDEKELGGTREKTDLQSDPHNAVAQFISEAEENDKLSPEDAAEARNILGEIGSNTEEAPQDKVERLRQLLEEVDPEAAAELMENLFGTEPQAG